MAPHRVNCVASSGSCSGSELSPSNNAVNQILIVRHTHTGANFDVATRTMAALSGMPSLSTCATVLFAGGCGAGRGERVSLGDGDGDAWGVRTSPSSRAGRNGRISSVYLGPRACTTAAAASCPVCADRKHCGACDLCV